jgi:hypothetical protein
MMGCGLISKGFQVLITSFGFVLIICLVHLRGTGRKYVVDRSVVPLMWHVQVRIEFICDYVTTLEKTKFLLRK